jgi:hypothetical protein
MEQLKDKVGSQLQDMVMDQLQLLLLLQLLLEVMSWSARYGPASTVASRQSIDQLQLLLMFEAAAATVAEATAEDNVSSQPKLGRGNRPTSAVANVEAAVAVAQVIVSKALQSCC